MQHATDRVSISRSTLRGGLVNGGGDLATAIRNSCRFCHMLHAPHTVPCDTPLGPYSRNQSHEFRSNPCSPHMAPTCIQLILHCIPIASDPEIQMTSPVHVPMDGSIQHKLSYTHVPSAGTSALLEKIMFFSVLCVLLLLPPKHLTHAEYQYEYAHHTP
jgi:hypothetical protein